MFTLYQDIETGEILSRDVLEKEWETLFNAGEIETETAGKYIANCMYWNNGTLVPYTVKEA